MPDPIAPKLPPLTVGWPHADAVAAQVSAPAFASVQGARAAGAVEGTILAAPLASSTGPIAGAAESLVVVTVKNFWDSPTIKAARNVIGGAIGAVFGVLMTTFVTVWSSGHSIFEKGAVNWRATEVSAEIAAGLIVASAFFAYKKTKDNNPTK